MITADGTTVAWQVLYNSSHVSRTAGILTYSSSSSSFPSLSAFSLLYCQTYANHVTPLVIDVNLTQWRRQNFSAAEAWASHRNLDFGISKKLCVSSLFTHFNPRGTPLSSRASCRHWNLLIIFICGTCCLYTFIMVSYFVKMWQVKSSSYGCIQKSNWKIGNLWFITVISCRLFFMLICTWLV